jgi:hypothetical protein
VRNLALNVSIEKRPNYILLIVVGLLAVGIYMAIISVHALITGSEYEGILVLESLDSTTSALVSVIFGVIFFILGFGLWNMMGWTRAVILIFAGLGVVFYPLRGLLIAANLSDPVLTSEIIGIIFTVLGILFSIFVLLILSKQEVILAFEANEMVRIRRRIGFLNEKMEIGRKRCNEGEISKAELSNLRSECLAEERMLKGRIRHFEKVRLGRERKIKERLEKKKKSKEEKIEKRMEKKAEKEEKKKEKEEEEEEEEEEEKEEDQKEEDEETEKEQKKKKKGTKEKNKEKE